MSRRDDLIALQQMPDHAREIQHFTAEKSFEDVRDNRLLALALIRLLEVVGEAATRVHRDTRANNPQIPWSQIISLRNRLIHGYDSIDLAVIWSVIRDDIPQLIPDIEDIKDRPT